MMNEYDKYSATPSHANLTLNQLSHAEFGINNRLVANMTMTQSAFRAGGGRNWTFGASANISPNLPSLNATHSIMN